MTDTPAVEQASAPAIPSSLASALAKRGYETLTPVQNKVIEPEFDGVDMLVSAQTGSGKTVAFGMAMAQTLMGDNDRLPRAERPLSLVIAPTRELALQVKAELEWLYAEAGVKMASCVGGMDYRTEFQALKRGPHIVVGTPGRLKDHIDRNSLDLSGLQVAVLDEADEMLNMGFSEDLEYILSASPKTRRTMMFSATVPNGIARLANKYQKNAVRVSTKSEASQHVDIDYRALITGNKDKENAIINVLRYYEAKNAIIFAGTRAAVNHMTARLNNRGFSVVSLSGELSQSQRTHALAAMRNGQARVCVATDVAARGIDLPDLELVIHADTPKNSEILLHRSGRTGRAGRKGTCVLVVPHSGRRRTERLLHDARVKAVWGNPPSAEDVRKRDDERLFAHEALNTPITESDAPMAAQLLEKFGADQVAGALLSMYREKRSAPEELRGNGQDEPRAPREDFSDGIWFELSVGRDHNAEPRWLLPMLFKAGNLQKGEVGAIKITRTLTYVEIAPAGIERFEQAIGPSGALEKNTHAKRLPSKPAAAERGGPRREGGGSGGGSGGGYQGRGGSRGDSGGGNDRKGPRDYSAKKGKPRYEGKKDGKKPFNDDFNKPRPSDNKSKDSYDAKRQYEDKLVAQTDYAPMESDPFYDNAIDARKGKPKKPHKKKLARAAARAAKDGKGPNGGASYAAPSTTGGGKAKAKPARKKPNDKNKNKPATGGDAQLMRRKRKD